MPGPGTILKDMTPPPQAIDAEQRMRTLLQDAGLPQPDRVEYGSTCVRFFFNDARHVVVIDLDDDSEDAVPGAAEGQSG